MYTPAQVANHEVNDAVTFTAQWNYVAKYVIPGSEVIMELEVIPEELVSGKYITVEVEIPGRGTLVPDHLEETPDEESGLIIVPCTFLYKLTFILNGGTTPNFQGDVSFNVKPDAAVSDITEVLSATKGEYVFKGWKNSNDGLIYSTVEVAEYVLKQPTTFSAQWNYVAMYVNEEGEVVYEVEVEAINLNPKGNYDTEEIKVPGKGILVPKNDEETPKSDGIILVPVPSAYFYNVSFDPNGGTISGSNEILIVKVKVGETVDAVNVPTATMSRNTFRGWADVSGVLRSASAVANIQVNGSIVFTAQWKAGEIIVDPEPITLTSAFAGNCATNTGEYLVAIGGVVSGKFAEGITNLTYDQILAQGINIYTINTIQFDSRTMASSTINSMKVTVENGKIVSVTIYGRAQTPKGNFDTYTVTIPTI